MGTIDSLRLFCPEATLTITIVVVLVLDLLMRDRPARHTALFTAALIGLAGAAWGCVHLAGNEATAIFSGMVALDSLAVFFKVFSLVVGALGIIFAAMSDEIERERFGEFLALLLSLTLGMTLLASANNLLMIYLSLEFVSITSYVLSGWRRHHRPASEAALKYVIYGGVASGIMLYGLSLMYGLAGTLDLTVLQEELADVATKGIATRAALTVGGIFTLAGFAYKVAAVPFHMWCPDVYEGAPTPFTAFLSVGPKAAGFAVLLRFFHVVMGGETAAIGDVFPAILIIGVVSVTTMTMGNLVALTQTNVKRLLAWSSVAHAGYLLLGLVAAMHLAATNTGPDPNTDGIRAVLIYLCVYLLMNLGAFLAVIAVRDRTGSEEISAYKGLAVRAPMVAILLTVFLFSLVGLPPFAGFVGKFYIFKALLEGFDRFCVTLALIGVINSAISLYYYAKIVRAMFLDAPETDAPPVRPRIAHVTVLFCLAVPTLILGVYWSPLAETLRNAVGILGV